MYNPIRAPIASRKPHAVCRVFSSCVAEYLPLCLSERCSTSAGVKYGWWCLEDDAGSWEGGCAKSIKVNLPVKVNVTQRRTRPDRMNLLDAIRHMTRRVGASPQVSSPASSSGVPFVPGTPSLFFYYVLDFNKSALNPENLPVNLQNNRVL